MQATSKCGFRSSMTNVIVGLVTIGLSIAIPAAFGQDEDGGRFATATMTSLPLYFEENRGQTDPSVFFVNRAGGTTTFFRDDDDLVRQVRSFTDQVDGERLWRQIGVGQ